MRAVGAFFLLTAACVGDAVAPTDRRASVERWLCPCQRVGDEVVCSERGFFLVGPEQALGEPMRETIRIIHQAFPSVKIRVEARYAFDEPGGEQGAMQRQRAQVEALHRLGFTDKHIVVAAPKPMPPARDPMGYKFAAGVFLGFVGDITVRHGDLNARVAAGEELLQRAAQPLYCPS